MSPSSKSKSKSAARIAKEPQKATGKPSGSSNAGNGTPASAYNPISRTFHMLDAPSPTSSPPYQDNGRFRNIDDTDDHSNPHGTLLEYDSVSNNGSCSGESEDLKEKSANSTRQEPIPCSDNDRREKIRLKNEKKHQRQKEKRAQELHDRCCGYLMSRKLEVLSQQLVAMGFSAERATLALMLNEGRVEESVNWLFEVSEEVDSKDNKLESGGNLKIDITDELARISAMEAKYKCSKQEIERAIVSCEGNLDKAEDAIKLQKQEGPASSSKSEEVADAKVLMKPQDKLEAPVEIQKQGEQEFNYAKATNIAPPTYSEPESTNLQSSQITNQVQHMADKRWGFSSSISAPVAASRQVTTTPLEVEARHLVFSTEGKNNQHGLVREPVTLIQRPQGISAKQIPASYVPASPAVTSGWYAKSTPATENARLNGRMLRNSLSNVVENQSLGQFHRPIPYKENSYIQNPLDSTSAGFGGSWSTMGDTTPGARSSWTAMGGGMSSSSLAVPSSLGLFASWGSTTGTLGSSSHVDWNTGGLIPECDYTNIDWTLDTSLSPTKTSGLWLGLSSLLRNSSGMRMNSGNGISGLQDSETSASSTGLREWTSPFAEKDIFSVPRQFVTSPSP